MALSLTDWSMDPTAHRSPLPPISTLRRGAYRVGLLPIEALAADLARRGVRYRRGAGFSAFGTLPLDDFEVARMTSVVLEAAGERLTVSSLPSARFFDHVDALDAEVDRLQAEAHAATDDYEAAEELFCAMSVGATALAVGIWAALDDVAINARDRAAALTGESFAEEGRALVRTARDVKASPAAQALLLKSLRRTMPEPETSALPSIDEVAVAAFLTSLEVRLTLRRAELPRLYEAAGRPGDASNSDLHELAAARWGSPRLLNGNKVYRPAAST